MVKRFVGTSDFSAVSTGCTVRFACRFACLLTLLVLTWPAYGMPGPQSLEQRDPSHHDPVASSSNGEKKPPPPDAYTGDESCAGCHKEQAQTYLKTSHHFTSDLPSAHSIAGNFNPGSNILQTVLPELTYIMSHDSQGYSESAVMQVQPSKTVTLTQPIDIVIGSGRKGQTYLYWKEDELYELPASYWTQSSQWTYSPGYSDGSINFDRPIVPRCLECHGSYFESLAPPLNRFSKTGLVLGITCEKCHGPGREHVTLMSSGTPPTRKAAMAIVNPASLPRARQIDVCSLCHAGALKPIATSLSFLPGDQIDKFLEVPPPSPDIKVDVHGNQVELLKRSRCYLSSSMTCSTCHDVHKQQRDAASFSQSCLTCHKVSSCGKFASLGKQIASDCVDCHMPLQKSQVLFSELNGEKLQPLVRNHQIAIYPEARNSGHNAAQPGPTAAHP